LAGPDTDLLDTIAAAEGVIAARCGPLVPTAVTATVRAIAGSAATVQVFPVISLTSATSSTGEVADLSRVTLSEAGVLTGLGQGTWTVVYEAGRVTCPPDLKQACLELVKHLWAIRRGAGSQRTPDTPGAAHLLPYRVQTLIEPYLLPGIG